MNKRMPKRLIALLIICLMVIAVAACGKNESNSSTGPANSDGNAGNINTDSNSSNNTTNSSNEGSNTSTSTSSGTPVRDTLRMAISVDFGVFDYTTVSGGHWYGMMLCLQEPLFDVVFTESGELEYVWLLATGYDEISPTEWVLHLREGATFSNGNPFTAEDVMFTIDNELNGGVSSGIRAQSIDLDNSYIIDDYTISLHFTEYNVQRDIAYSDMTMFDHRTYHDTDFSTDPVGTGPYKLTEHVINSHIKMERRDDYWGEKPQIKYLEFLVMAEPSQVVNALQAGEIDVGDIAGQDVEFVKSLPGYTVADRTEGSWASAQFNLTDKSVMGNVDARRAFAHAINSQAIVNMVFYGYCDVMKSIVNPIVADHEARFENIDDTYTIGYNPELAKQYAEKSGLVGKTVRIATNSAPEFILIAEIIQGNLGAIGVNSEIINFDAPTFNATLRDFDIWDVGLSNGIAPNKWAGDALFMVLRTNLMIGYNPNCYWEGQERYHEIMPESLFNPDPKERSDVLYELQQIFADQVLRYSICTRVYQTAFSTDLEGPFLIRVSQQRRFQDFKFKTL